MTTASIKKELHRLGTKDLWEIVSYAQSLLRREQIAEADEDAFLESEYEAAKKMELNEAQLAEIDRLRTALLNGTDKGLTHEEVILKLKSN